MPRSLVADALEGADDGELYLEYSQSEGLVFDNGRLKVGELRHQPGIRAARRRRRSRRLRPLRRDFRAGHPRAADAVQAVKSGHTGTYADAAARTNVSLYGDESPLASPNFADKVKLLETIDAYARGRRTSASARSPPRSPAPTR